MPFPPGPHEEKAQTPALGVVLMMGVTIVGVTVVLYMGAAGVSSGQQQATDDAAATAMTQVDARAALVAHGDAAHHSVPMSTRSADVVVDPSAGWMNVSVHNASTDEVDVEVMNETLGAIRYHTDGTRLAYQGGGVWRSDGEASAMVSPPEFHYQVTRRGPPTVTLPVILVRGGGPIVDEVVLSDPGSAATAYPIAGDSARSNPLSEGKVVITVHSEYYDGWGRYFATRTAANVTFDHAAETAQITLQTPFDESFANLLSSTDPNGIAAHPGPPPAPYRMGVDYPSADALVEEHVTECETDPAACDETPPASLTAGTYYYDGGASGDFDIDTSAGNVTIVVNGSFTPGTVNVSGGNHVTVYAKGDFAFGGGDTVNKPGPAERMTVVVHSDGDVDMNGNFQFFGLLYAPESDVDLNGGGPPWLTNVIGGIVGETVDINGNPNKFEHDSSISNVQLDLDEETATISYLHVSTSVVEVSGE